MKKSRSVTKDFQEVYYLNTSEYDMTRPCLRVHSFCHSIFYPGFLYKKSSTPDKAYIAAAIILKGGYERKTSDGERRVFKEGYFQLWRIHEKQTAVSLPYTHLERYFILFRVNRLLLKILDELFPEELPTFQAKDPSKLKKCFEEIRRILRKQGTTDELLLSTAGFRLLTEAANQIKQTKQEKPASLQQALEFIHENFNDVTLTREMTAEHAGISTTLLGKLFRKYMDTTVNNYILSLRMEKAKHLLSFTDLPVAFVGEKCGFASSGYFINVFRKYFGTTPAVYRKNLLYHTPVQA